MLHIHLRREHRLGLAPAREIARQWALQAEQTLQMNCRRTEGPEVDTVAFSRAGVDGCLTVAADHFELEARLGFLLGGFSAAIEAQIHRELDQWLGSAPPMPNA